MKVKQQRDNNPVARRPHKIGWLNPKRSLWRVNGVVRCLSLAELRSRLDVLLDSRDNCHSLVVMTIEKFDCLDISIHNAGWGAYQTVQNLTPDFIQRAININIEAPTWLSQAAFPWMKQQHYGRIVLTTSDRSIYQQYTLSGLAAYAMGKMAQIGLMNVLAVENKERGILVNAISPVAKTRMSNV